MTDLSKTRKENLAAYLFLLPALTLFFLFTCFPFVYGFVITLFKWDGFTDMIFVGFQNYIDIFRQELFYGALQHNGIYALGSVSGKVILALVTALLLNRKFKGVTFFRAVFFVPVVMSFIAIGVLWSWIYNPSFGLLDAAAMKLGIMTEPVEWLGDPKYALFSLIIVDIWRWTGYHTVLFLAGLQTIPNDLYESADIDGASAWQRLLRITLPQLRPITLINITISLMGAFSVFDIVFIMTRGGPYNSTSVLATYMYDITFGAESNFGYGSSVAYILFAVILVISVIQSRLMSRED